MVAALRLQPARKRTTDSVMRLRARLAMAVLGSILLFSQAASATNIVPAGPNVSWPYQTYVSAPFTPPVLNITRPTSAKEGYFFFAPNGPDLAEQGPLIMDAYGNLVWNGPSEHTSGFGVQKYRGQNVLVSWNGTLYTDPLGLGFGTVKIINKHYETIANVKLPGNFVTMIPGLKFPSNIDLHEATITPNNTLIVTAYNVTQADLSSVGGPKKGWIHDDQAYEIDIATGKVLFAWKSLDHLKKLPLKGSFFKLGDLGFDGKQQSTAWQYFHINAVAPYNDGFLISSRYLCTVAAVDRSGKVLWVLQGATGGDFKLGPGADFCFQHRVYADPPYATNNNTEVTLYMHDNHNCPVQNGTVPSSAKILDINLQSKLATLQRKFLNASNPVYSVSMGSIQKLPSGNFFVGRGSVPILEEYSAAGKVLSTIQFAAAKPFPRGGLISDSPPSLSFRAFKQPWVGCPRAKPSLVIRNNNNSTIADLSGTTLYISWNGATQLRAWRISSGIESPSYTETVNATGFETVVAMPGIEFARVAPVLMPGSPSDCGQNATSDLVFAPGVDDRRRAEITRLMSRYEEQ